MGDYSDWEKLCVEYKEADESIRQAFLVVNQGFADCYKGQGAGPTGEAISNLEIAQKKRDDVERRMDQYIKRENG